MPNENPKLTITLTGQPPVKITKDEWPIVASSEDKAFDTDHEVQANRRGTWKLLVRQHRDGQRTIVYGIYTYTSLFLAESDYDIRAGELLHVGDADQIIAAVQRVGADLESRMPVDARYGAGRFPRLVHECIADLPAVEL